MSNLALKVLEEFNEEEKIVIKSWAEDAIVIRNDNNLSKKEKIKKISQITNNNKIILKLIKGMAKFIKRHSWDERGWPARFALGGLTIGAAAGGTKAAGIATMGAGIGVPIIALTSAGGALLGTIVEELSKKK
jgi:hypothetical protein